MDEGLPGPSGSEQQPAAPAGFVQPRLDFSVTYSMAGNSSEGIVPTITVGNVYAIAREGYVSAVLAPSFRDFSLDSSLQTVSDMWHQWYIE